mgnify:CR=1 FL=1
MQKRVIVGLLISLVITSTSSVSPSKADYPAIPGLSLVLGSTDIPIAVDLTPKSIPANSKVTTLTEKQKTLTATAGQPVVCKFTNLPKSAEVQAEVRYVGASSYAFLGTVKTDKNGRVQLPAFGLSKPGLYLLTVTFGKTTKTIKVTVN